MPDICIVILRRKILLLLVLVDLMLFATVCFGQQPDTNMVQRIAIGQLEQFNNSDKLHRFKHKHYPETHGTIIADLVLKGKKVETVFVVQSDVEPMMFNNAFCNFLKDMEFEFKLPKGEREKVRYTFVFAADK